MEDTIHQKLTSCVSLYGLMSLLFLLLLLLLGQQEIKSADLYLIVLWAPGEMLKDIIEAMTLFFNISSLQSGKVK